MAYRRGTCGITLWPATTGSFRLNVSLAHHRYSQGWQITGISRFNTGFPVSLSSGGDFALTNIGLDFPTQVAPFQKLNPHAPAHNFFNTSAFASNLSCGYEVCGVTGSAKQFALPRAGNDQHRCGCGERHENHGENATQPAPRNVQCLQPCQLPSSATVGNANSGQFGQATNTAPARIGQISGKFIF